MSEKKTEKVNKKEGMINWLKDHKVEVAAVAVAGAGILYAVISNKHSSSAVSNALSKLEDPYEKVRIDIPEKLAGKVTDISGPGEWFDIWCERVPLSELGSFGEELVKTGKFDSTTSVGGVITATMK